MLRSHLGVMAEVIVVAHHQHYLDLKLSQYNRLNLFEKCFL